MFEKGLRLGREAGRGKKKRLQERVLPSRRAVGSALELSGKSWKLAEHQARCLAKGVQKVDGPNFIAKNSPLVQRSLFGLFFVDYKNRSTIWKKKKKKLNSSSLF